MHFITQLTATVPHTDAGLKPTYIKKDEDVRLQICVCVFLCVCGTCSTYLINSCVMHSWTFSDWINYWLHVTMLQLCSMISTTLLLPHRGKQSIFSLIKRSSGNHISLWLHLRAQKPNSKLTLWKGYSRKKTTVADTVLTQYVLFDTKLYYKTRRKVKVGNPTLGIPVTNSQKLDCFKT